MIQGNVGPYKVVYLKGKTDIIYGKMFDRIEVALDFAHKLPSRWILSQKVGHDNDDYAWKVLPYGAYKSLSIGVKIDNARFVVMFLIAILAIYYITKLLPKAKTLY